MSFVVVEYLRIDQRGTEGLYVVAFQRVNLRRRTTRLDRHRRQLSCHCMVTFLRRAVLRRPTSEYLRNCSFAQLTKRRDLMYRANVLMYLARDHGFFLQRGLTTCRFLYAFMFFLNFFVNRLYLSRKIALLGILNECARRFATLTRFGSFHCFAKRECRSQKDHCRHYLLTLYQRGLSTDLCRFPGNS